MRKQFTGVLALALVTSMFTTGYCENNATNVAPSIQAKSRIIKPNVSVKSPSKTSVPINQQTIKTEATKNPVNSKIKSLPANTSKSFLEKPPTPIKYMQAPNPQSFQAMVKKDYHLSMPTNFGPDPLANMPGTDGPMVVRVRDNTIFMAINVIDPSDTTSFNATKSLPKLEQTKPLLKWVFGTQEKLECIASEYNGFYGNTIIIEGKQLTNGKTYELLFSFPQAQIFEYLPTVLYSLNSFKANL